MSTIIHALGLSLQVPSSYRIQMLVLAGPPEQFAAKEPSYLRNVVVAREDIGTTSLDGYVRAQLAHLSRSMQGFHRVRTETLIIDGVSCPLLEIRCLGPGGILIANLLAYVPAGESVYTLSASHLAGPRFEAVREELRAVMQSFAARATSGEQQREGGGPRPATAV